MLRTAESEYDFTFSDNEVMTESLDIAAARNRQPYSRWELLRRILWMLCQPLFRFSPRPCFGWRRWLLRRFGARVGQHVNMYGSSVIYMPWNLTIGDWSSLGEHAFIYNLGPVTIGSRATISGRAHLCAGTHDHTDPSMPLMKPPIIIKDQAWICADAFVGPGVTVGQGAVVAARAVVVKDIEPWSIVAGNPARRIKQRELKKAEEPEAS